MTWRTVRPASCERRICRQRMWKENPSPSMMSKIYCSTTSTDSENVNQGFRGTRVIRYVTIQSTLGVFTLRAQQAAEHTVITHNGVQKLQVAWFLSTKIRQPICTYNIRILATVRVMAFVHRSRGREAPWRNVWRNKHVYLCNDEQQSETRYRQAKRLPILSQGRNQKYISGERSFLRSVSFPFLPLQPPNRFRGLTHFGVFRAQGTCLLAANVFLFLLNKI